MSQEKAIEIMYEIAKRLSHDRLVEIAEEIQEEEPQKSSNLIEHLEL